MNERVVIVGASLAGLRTAETLRQLGHEGPIVLVGAEAHLPYDRPPLSKQVLTGKADPADTALRRDESLEVEWLLSTRATGLDLDRNRVSLDVVDDIPFDRLVIATGASPRRIAGMDPGPGVHYLRTLDDSIRLKADLAGSARTVVIGAGFIGLEVASSAHQLGVPVTVLEALPVPLERSIGATMGAQVAAWHQSKGIDLRLGVGVESLEGQDRPEAVRLSDGTIIEADTVVVGVGVAPEVAWLEGSGVDLADGVVCDDRLRVLASGRSLPHVVAVGDACRWAHPTLGRTVRVEHWTHAVESGEAAAHTLTRGDEADPYGPTPYFWSDQHGLKLQFVGRAEPEDEVLVLEGSFEEERFVVAYGRAGRLVGALTMRRPARVMALQRQIAAGGAFPPED